MSKQQRLPIHHDDVTFHDRQKSIFDDMRRKMEADMNRPFLSRGTFDDQFERMRSDFFHLKPSDSAPVRTDNWDSMDDRSVYVDDPSGRRVFQVSFDLREYNPQEVSVKVQDNHVIVEAKHEEVGDDGTSKSCEFSRRIKVPHDVDEAKLTSTLSNDKILTIQAPVPPRYSAITERPDEGRASPRVLMTDGRSSPRVIYASQTTQSPIPVTVSTGLTAGMPVKVDLSVPPVDEVMWHTDRGCTEMTLHVEVGGLYKPEEVMVRVDGRTLVVSAEHIDRSSTKCFKYNISKEFYLKDTLNAKTISAMLKDGKLKVSASVQK